MKDYQPPRMLGVEGVSAKWGIGIPEALYLLWLHHVPIRTQRGGLLPPPIRVPLALPANLPQPLIAPAAAPEQPGANPVEPTDQGRTFQAREVAIITGRRLNTVYSHIYTGKLRADDRPRGSGRQQPYQIREADLRDYIRETFKNSDELLANLDIWPDAARTTPLPGSGVAPVSFLAPIAPRPPAVVTPEPAAASTAEPAGTGRLFTVDEIAAMLRMSKAAVYRHIKAGSLRAIDISGGGRPTYRVWESDLRQWLGDSAVILDRLLAGPA